MGNVDKKDLAVSAYTLINSNASSNAWIQGITGVVGFPFTTLGDCGVVATHYIPMFNQIRRIYGRPPLSAGVIGSMIKNIAQELLLDVVFDKVLGNIPLVGIPLNYVAARTMSWRLGILFSILAARGDEVDEDTVRDAVIVIRGIFPKSPFGFHAPPLSEFERIVNSFYGASFEEFRSKIQNAKDALAG